MALSSKNFLHLLEVAKYFEKDVLIPNLTTKILHMYNVTE